MLPEQNLFLESACFAYSSCELKKVFVLQALSKDVFSTYVCRTIKHPESRPHPGDIAEATSLR